MAKTSTRSAVKAQLLTAITVAAAGVAAYAVANLSEPTAVPGSTSSQSFSQEEIRRSCVYTCQDNHGFPCGAYVADPDQRARCEAGVQACINKCPAPGPGMTILRGDLSVESLPAATKGVAYRQRLAIAAYEQEQGEWSVSEGALPPGLELDKLGTISGTPSAADRYRFTLLYTIPEVKGVRDAIRVKANVEMAVNVGTVATTGTGTAPSTRTFDFSGINLGNIDFGIGSGGTAAPATTAAPSVRITTPLQGITITQNQDYRLRVAAEGISSTQLPRWFVTYGALPPGMKLSWDGVIDGAPTEVGSYSFGVAVSTNESGPNAAAYVDASIKVIASTGSTGSTTDTTIGGSTGVITNDTTTSGAAAGTKVVTPSMIPANATLPAGRVGTYASFPFSVNGSTSDLTWSVEGITERDGMKFDTNTHVLYGTPLRAATYTIKVRAMKGTEIITRTYTWVVAANVSPLDVVTTLPDGQANQNYSTLLRASGGTGAYRWAFDTPSAVGREWSLTESGELKGMTPKEGVYTFFVRITDTGANIIKVVQMVVNVKQVVATPNATSNTTTSNTNPNTNTNTGTTVNGQMLTIDKALPEGVAGTEYRFPLKVSGGSGSYRWKFATGADVSTGWALSEAGELKSTSPREGNYAFLVRAEDIQNPSLYQQSEVRVIIRAATTNTTNANTNTTQTTSGTSNPSSNTTTNTSTTTSSGPLAFRDVGTYPDGFTTHYYNARPFDMTGGRGAYRYSITGNLPDGLTMNSSGYILGTPTRVGTYNFVMTVRDESGDSVQASRVIRIREATEFIYADSVPLASNDPALRARLDVFARIGVQTHNLVKLQDDGDPNTQYDSTVYYLGSDGRRHAFPNPQVYFTWYQTFASVRIVGAHDLADIPLGANITYRPGVRLVKFLSEPRVYAVDRSRQLRWVRTEVEAQAIYGTNWATNVDDISDAFYMDYRINGIIDTPSNFRPSEMAASVNWPSDVLP